MTLLADHEIRSLAEAGMISPFVPELVREEHGCKVLSYGLSSYGYDLRLSPKEFFTFRRIPSLLTDPKNFDPCTLARAPLFHEADGSAYFIIPAHSYGLGVALERLEIPSDVTAIFIGKSTYARCGLICNLTPAESGWKGHLTLEFSNSSGADCKIYANEGIAQALFFKGEPCATTYEARTGKYQDQAHAVVTARI